MLYDVNKLGTISEPQRESVSHLQDFEVNIKPEILDLVKLAGKGVQAIGDYSTDKQINEALGEWQESSQEAISERAEELKLTGIETFDQRAERIEAWRKNNPHEVGIATKVEIEYNRIVNDLIRANPTQRAQKRIFDMLGKYSKTSNIHIGGVMVDEAAKAQAEEDKDFRTMIIAEGVASGATTELDFDLDWDGSVEKVLNYNEDLRQINATIAAGKGNTFGKMLGHASKTGVIDLRRKFEGIVVALAGTENLGEALAQIEAGTFDALPLLHNRLGALVNGHRAELQTKYSAHAGYTQEGFDKWFDQTIKPEYDILLKSLDSGTYETTVKNMRSLRANEFISQQGLENILTILPIIDSLGVDFLKLDPDAAKALGNLLTTIRGQLLDVAGNVGTDADAEKDTINKAQLYTAMLDRYEKHTGNNISLKERVLTRIDSVSETGDTTETDELVVDFIANTVMPTAITSALQTLADKNDGQLDLNDPIAMKTVRNGLIATNEFFKDYETSGNEEDVWKEVEFVDRYLKLADSDMVRQYIKNSDSSDPFIMEYQDNVSRVLKQELQLMRFQDYTGYVSNRISQDQIATGFEIPVESRADSAKGGAPFLQSLEQEGTSPPSNAAAISSQLREEEAGGLGVGLANLATDLSKYYQPIGAALQLGIVDGELGYVINTEGLAPFNTETQRYLENLVVEYNFRAKSRLNRFARVLSIAEGRSLAEAQQALVQLDSFDTEALRGE